LSYSFEHNTFYRLAPIIQWRVSAKKRGEPISETQWDELVRDIWKDNGLKHLRNAATPFEYEEAFVYDPSKGTHGFQEGYEMTEDDQFVFIDPSDHDELDNQPLQNQPARDLDEPTQSHVEETFQPSVPADKPHLEEVASTLSVNDISEFLKEIELADLTELFSKNGVDGSLLIELSDNDLKDLGVAKGFIRKKIVTKFKAHLVKLKKKQLQ